MWVVFCYLLFVKMFRYRGNAFIEKFVEKNQEKIDKIADKLDKKLGPGTGDLLKGLFKKHAK